MLVARGLRPNRGQDTLLEPMTRTDFARIERWAVLLPLSAVGAHVAGHVVKGPLFWVSLRVIDALGLGFGYFRVLLFGRALATGLTIGAVFVLVAAVVAPSRRRHVATLALATAAGWALWAAWSAPVAPIPDARALAVLFSAACVAGGAGVWATVRDRRTGPALTR